MTGATSKGPRWALWLPLIVFAAFVVLVIFGLFRPADREVQSAMIGKPLPEFALEPAVAERPGLSSADFRGEGPRLLNVFASWCIPCRIEAPQLDALSKAGVEIHGVAIRDTREDVEDFLSQYGNPFARIGKDDLSEVQLGIGSSGVPETFVVDANGIIRYQHIGVIRAEDMDLIMAELRKAGA